MERRSAVPVLVIIASGLAGVLVKMGRVVSPDTFDASIYGAAPSAMTAAGMSWTALLVVADIRTKRALIAGLIFGAVCYEFSQVTKPGRTFDWLDVAATVIAALPAWILAAKYGRLMPRP